MEAFGFVPPQMDQTPASKELHDDYHGAICDVCDFPILGVRFKCLNCADFDICAACEQEGLHAGHPDTHLFVVLPRPVPKEAEDWKALFPLPLCVDEAGKGTVHRGVFCTQCKAPVVGSRYVCTNCPDMFCLCDGCFSGRLPVDKHANGRNHVMVKIPFAPSPVSPEIDSSSSGEYQYGIAVDASLYKTPDCLLPNSLCLQHPGILVKSPLECDVRVPLLPVVYTGEAAVNPLSRSAERRELAESGIHRAAKLARKRQPKGVEIREMTMEDVDESVMQIENESFACPFQRNYFVDMLARGNYFAWVATVDGAVVGYVALKCRKNWTEIQSLAVTGKARGLGVGRSLMERALSLAEAYETSVRLHVSVWNVAAMQLYKSLGFVSAKWLFDYYSREEEDAIEMYIQRH